MIHVFENQNHKSDLQDHQRSRWMTRSLMGATSWFQRLWMRSSPYRLKGKCSWRASTVQWLCPHQVEMEMILAEIVEIDENQNETMGRILQRMMKMKMKKKVHAGHAQPWMSRGKEWLGRDPLDTGFGDVAEAPSRMWRRARMGQRSSMGCSVPTCPGKGSSPRAVDPASSSHMTKEEKVQRRQLRC